MKNKKLTIITVLVILTLSTLRILAGTTIPTLNGDEIRRAQAIDHIIKGEEVKRSTFKIGNIPIFIKTDAGFSSPLFLTPATLWASLFGTSPTSLRIFVAIITTLALILLAFCLAIWYKNSRKVFLLAVCIALTLPWLILQGFIFWDTSFAPVFFILAFYAFTKLKFAKTPLFRHQLLLTLSLVLSVYIYLPSAVPAVILYFAALIYLAKTKIFHIKQIIISCATAILASLPFIIFFLTFPDGNTRTGELNVFYQTDILTGIGRLFANFGKLLGPTFLFITGDPNPRHNLCALGTLGSLSFVPIFWSFFYRIKNFFTKNEKLLFLISLLGIASATLSSALTHPDAQPHSLRANAAAPFYILLIFLGAHKFIERHPKAAIPIYIAIAATALAYYLLFFLHYPSYGHQFFI